MVWIDSEGHQLLQRHFILGIKVEQGRGHGGEFRALLDHLWRDEEGGCDLFVAPILLPQRHEGAELIERMQGSALHVLSKRVVFGVQLSLHRSAAQAQSYYADVEIAENPAADLFGG